MTELLLAQPGCVVNARDKKDRRALHFAAYMGHDAVVKALIDKAADVDVKVCASVWLIRKTGKRFIYFLIVSTI